MWLREAGTWDDIMDGQVRLAREGISWRDSEMMPTRERLYILKRFREEDEELAAARSNNA